jgi:hypothetical protein
MVRSGFFPAGGGGGRKKEISNVARLSPTYLFYPLLRERKKGKYRQEKRVEIGF